jgi:hypothetical protein
LTKTNHNVKLNALSQVRSKTDSSKEERDMEADISGSVTDETATAAAEKAVAEQAAESQT